MLFYTVYTVKKLIINILTSFIPYGKIRRKIKDYLRNFTLKRFFTKKTKYDFIFSMGDACFVAMLLRDLGLRKASGPFDWMSGSTFETRMNIFINKFERYFEKEDLEYIGIDRNNNRDTFVNNYTGLSYNHDFTRKEFFFEEYYIVREKYERRIARLFNNIKQGEKILIVYAEMRGSKQTDDKVIIDLLKQANNKYDDKIDLLYIRSNEKIKSAEITKIRKINKHLKIAEYKGYIPDLEKINKEESKKVDYSLLDIMACVKV